MKLARTLAIADVFEQGSDAVEIRLTGEGDAEPALDFTPGQYLTVAADVDGNELWRCYSITSPPTDRRAINILVRRVANGRVSNLLCDTARRGGTLRVLPPAGRFLLARPGAPVLLFAGGSGIAPILSLARQALAEQAPCVRLFYANRDRDTVMMADQLEALEAGAEGRFEIVPWFDDTQGLPGPADLRAIGDGLGDADAYLCGPEPFMQAVRKALLTVGHDEARIHQESFAADMEVPAPGDGPAATLKVKMKGQVYEIPVEPGQPLLSAMLKAGLPAPHSCKVGECASCMCRVLDGDITMAENSVLDGDDVAEGWALACSSRAASSSLTISFA